MKYIKDFDSHLKKPISAITKEPLYNYKNEAEYNYFCKLFEDFVMKERTKLFNGIKKKYSTLYKLDYYDGQIYEYKINNVLFGVPYLYPLISYENYVSQKFSKQLDINDFIRNFHRNTQEEIWNYFDAIYVNVDYKGIVNTRNGTMLIPDDYLNIGVNLVKKEAEGKGYVKVTEDLDSILKISEVLKMEYNLPENGVDYETIKKAKHTHYDLNKDVDVLYDLYKKGNVVNYVNDILYSYSENTTWTKVSKKPSPFKSKSHTAIHKRQNY